MVIKIKTLGVQRNSAEAESLASKSLASHMHYDPATSAMITDVPA